MISAADHFKFDQAAESRICFVNPFTGNAEEWVSQAHASRRMFEEAAIRIGELRAELDALKASLTNPTTGK